MDQFQQQIGHLIGKGLQKCHPNTIAHVLKVQLLPILYGVELANFTCSDLISMELLTNFISTIQDSFFYRNN